MTASKNGSGVEQKNADIRRYKGADAFILAMAEGMTVRDAAGIAGIAERTAYQRWGDPDWQKAIQAKRTEMFGEAAARLGAALTRAVDTLESLLNSDKDSVRLSAARSIIQAAIPYREAVDVEERIAALELQIAQSKAAGS